MAQFDKLVVLDPLNVPESFKDRLGAYAKKVVSYDDVPATQQEVIERIGDADAVLLNFTSTIGKEALDSSSALTYVGMASSLYSPESANVDILAAEDRGITVTGVRDYGDEGVVEYVISELVRLLHGFGDHQWRDEPYELTGVPVGIIGLGTTGTLIARGLRFFGAEVSYYSRTRKLDVEQREGLDFLPLDELLQHVDIVCTCLNKNVVLLHQREFDLLGNSKIVLNTSIAPSHDVEALGRWLTCKDNYMLGDSTASIDPSGGLLDHENVLCVHQSSGITTRAKERLADRTLRNIEDFLSAK